MILRNLQSWAPPTSITSSLRNANASFDLILGNSNGEHASAILDHIKTHNRQGVAEIYRLALSDPQACSIVRAIRPESGEIVGTVVVYSDSSALAEFVPALGDCNDDEGGIIDGGGGGGGRGGRGGVSSPVVSPSAGEYGTILQSLILLGVRQVKRFGAAVCVLDYMDGDGQVDGLSAMGFTVLHTCEEVSCDAATITRST
jgi:beta-N-acetylhexosaminidase